MNGRMSVAIAALAMFGTALAGCIEAPAFLSEADFEITALERKQLADDAAAAWDPAATLTGVFTLELSEASEDIPADPNVGNGESLLWYYAYTSGDGQTARAIRVTADGGVFVENSTMGAAAYGQDVQPLSGWSVDSNAAVTAARENEIFATAISGERPFLAEGVAHFEGVVGWYLAAISDAGGAIAAVDATTGSLLYVHEWDFDLDFAIPAFSDAGFAYRPDAEPTHLEGEGTLDADADAIEIPFVVEVLDATGHLAFKIDRDVPTDGLYWTILDADGEEVDYGSVYGLMGEGKRKFDLELDGPGAYTLVLEYASWTMWSPVGLPGETTYAFMLQIGEMEHDHDEDKHEGDR